MMKKKSIHDSLVRIQELPTLPTVLVRILNIAADPDGTALELGQLISNDQSLSASLLRLVNSPYYGFYRKIESVTQAIVMVGFFEVRRLALTATAFHTLRPGSTRFDHIQLWRHSLAAAIAAERCAYAAGVPVHGCFESGLLHDIGKVALDIVCPQEYEKVLQVAQKGTKRIRAVEQELLGVDHAEAGGLLGEHWNLPSSVTEAIRCHHAPEDAREFPELAALTALANYITYQANLGEFSAPVPAECPRQALELLNFRGNPCEDIAFDLENNRARIEEFIGAVKSDAA
ncbi:MAG TPA: HDOD domain-containing protein [Candidatus Hydrogenedentes bacterium]|nr:HDOD domain-containing protein [Candidatus Hydrogenedentota bacterium]